MLCRSRRHRLQREAALAPSGERRVAQFRQRVQPPVEQVPAGDVAERAHHRVLDLRVLDLELRDEPLDALALQAQIAAGRTAAADDRQLALPSRTRAPPTPARRPADG